MFEQTAALWRRLLGRPQTASSAADAGTAEDERRVWVRVPADLQTQLAAPDRPDEAGVAARIRDVSRGGIKLLVDRPFDPGSMLTVVLPAADGKSSLSVLACVVHCQPVGADEWHLGCSFSAELDDDDLDAFGAIKERPIPPDGRNWARFPCGEVTATVVRLSDSDPHRYPARVRDISASGVALLVSAEIPTGTLLDAELSGPDHRSFTILACVVHVGPAPEGGYVLGCNFIRELNETDLQALL
jgi:c-di-GMP-binding flagellar brake protein YcgR